MRTTNLKIAIRTAVANTRFLRGEATKTIRQGRALRAKAEATDSREKFTKLRAEGRACPGLAEDLRFEANKGRFDRRMMHLAAALLHNRSYEQCERGTPLTAQNVAKQLGDLIRPYLPHADKIHSEHLAQTWLQTRTTRLAGLCVDSLTFQREQAEHQMALAAIDKEIEAAVADGRHLTENLKSHERHIMAAREAITKSQGAITKGQEALVMHTEVLTGLQAKRDARSRDMRLAEEAHKASKAITLTVDDLFSEAA